MIDDALRGQAFGVARTLVPRVTQGDHGVVGVEACDRKPELDASALARAGRGHDPGRDPLAGQQLAMLLELAHSPFGDDRQVVTHGGKDTPDDGEANTVEWVGVVTSAIDRSGIGAHRSRVGGGCTRYSETTGSCAWRSPHVR